MKSRIVVSLGKNDRESANQIGSFGGLVRVERLIARPLVPKLRLGTYGPKLCFENGKRSFQDVGSQAELGNQ